MAAPIPGTIRFKEILATPSTPPAGYCLLYVKTDNVVYIKDDSGVETALGSASAITALTGEATASGPGSAVITLSNSAVIGKVLTGFVSGPNSTVLATDSILQAIEKLQAQVSGTSGTAITALTGDVSATGPGSAVATVNSVGGKTASAIATSVNDTQAATSTNTASTIVKRDASGNFTASTVTANLTGSASNNVLKAGDTMTGALNINVTSVAALAVGTNVLVADTSNGRIGINKLSPTQALDVVGNGTLTGTITASNLSGTNTGNVTVTDTNSIDLTIVGQALSADVRYANATIDENASGIKVATGGITNNEVNTAAAIARTKLGSGSAFRVVTNDVTGVMTDAAAITANRALISDANGIPTHSVTTATELSYVNGVTSSIQTQLNSISGSAITSLTGDVTGTGPGATATTVVSVGGKSAASIATSVNDTQAATDANTPSTIVKRDASGNITVQNLTAIGTISASNFSGSSSGTNTGDITVNPVGAVPNANGISLSGQSVTLEPADGTRPGVLTSIAQSIGGIKTFLAKLLISDTTQSTDKDTGSLITEGGIGVEKNINAGGNISAIGTITGSNISGSTSGTNTGDVTISDTNSIDLTLVGQLLSADLKYSTDTATASFIKASATTHATGLHVETEYDIPVQIGTSNIAGSGLRVAAYDHVHNHGNQTAPTHHAIATTIANGFMSSADKVKLDSISATVGTNTQILISDGTTYNPRTVSGDLTNTNAGVFTVNKIQGTTVTGTTGTGNVVLSASPTLTGTITAAAANFSGTITASNFTGSSSGTNTGDITLAAVGAVPNANAASLSGQVLNLQPADNTNPGVITSGVQTIGGSKTFSADTIVSSTTQSTTKDNGSLVLEGGLGVEKNINAGGNIVATGTIGASNFSGSSSGTNTGDQTITLTGDVTGSGTGSFTTTISANVVTNAKLAQMPTLTIKGNNTGGTANALDLTVAQVNTMLGDVTTLAAFGTSPNANGASISGNTLTLQPANGSFPGGVSTTTQTIAGSKTFSSDTIISSASTAALTINTNAFIFDSTNQTLGIGVTPNTATIIDAINTSGAAKPFQATAYGTGSTVGFRGRFARGTSGSPTAANSGDILNFMSGRGYGASQFATASTGAITITAAETFTNTSNRTYVTINTTPTGSVTSTENMRVDSTGITIGPQSSSTAVHKISGGLIRTTRTITANLTLDTTTADDIIYCNNSGAISITLPPPVNGRTFLIKDIAGTANTNNITLVRNGSEKIEGLSASRLLQTNWGSWTVTTNGTDWFIS